MTFTSKTDLILDATKVSASNIEHIAQTTADYSVHNGKLIDGKGAEVPEGTYVVKFSDGSVRVFSENLFEKLFVKVEPPAYKLSDIPDFSKGIYRKGWTDCMIKLVEDVVWIYYDNGYPVTPYNFTKEDLTASDWMIPEE